MIRLLRLLVLFFVCLGCGFVSARPLDRSLGLGSGAQGRILDQESLAVGGNVLIIPFSAGVHAAASSKLDQAALIMMRGMMDGLDQGDGRFHILDATDDRDPDFVITGQIVRFDVRGQWMRYLGGSRSRVIELEGRVLDLDGQLVAVFSHSLTRTYGSMTEIDFLLKAGQDVGMFFVQ